MKKKFNTTGLLVIVLLFAFVVSAFHTLPQYFQRNETQTTDITKIENLSNLERNVDSPQFFSGTLSLKWNSISNATGYEVEFNYDPIVKSTEEASLYLIGGFYSYKHAGEEQLRIRSYHLNDGEKIYGEFSEWINLNIQEDQSITTISVETPLTEITDITNTSHLERNVEHINQYSFTRITGKLEISWNKVLGAVGYELSFSSGMIVEVNSPYYRCESDFQLLQDLEKKIAFRIRAYGLIDDVKVYGESSDWITVDIE